MRHRLVRLNNDDLPYILGFQEYTSGALASSKRLKIRSRAITQSEVVEIEAL